MQLSGRVFAQQSISRMASAYGDSMWFLFEPPLGGETVGRGCI